MNGGLCIDGVDSFKCSCPDSASGVLCQCISTPEGQYCQPFPHWFENKPYQPNVPFDRKFFGTQFNISYQQNDSVITVSEDVYMTSVSGIAEYPSAVVTNDYLISSLITPTFSLDSMDVFTSSSVISAKISMVYSKLPSITVPYFSSELYESPSSSSSIDPSLIEQSKPMQPTPVLPVLTSSPAPEESVTFYEYLTETNLLLPTPITTLEGSFPTPSTESISLSHVLVSDVSIDLSVADAKTESTPMLTPNISPLVLPLLTPKLVAGTLTSIQDSVMKMFLPVDDRDGNLIQATKAGMNSYFYTVNSLGNKLVSVPFTTTLLSENINMLSSEAAFPVSITALIPSTGLTKYFLLPTAESITSVDPLFTKSVITQFGATVNRLDLTYEHHRLTYKVISSSVDVGNTESETTIQLFNSSSYVLSNTGTSTSLYISELPESTQKFLQASVRNVNENEDNNLTTSTSSNDGAVGSGTSKSKLLPATETMSVTENVSKSKRLHPHSFAPILAPILGRHYHATLTEVTNDKFVKNTTNFGIANEVDNVYLCRIILVDLPSNELYM